jgi:cell division protein FtsZ
MPIVTTTIDPVARIKVVGVGGGGCNAVNTMIRDFDIQGVDFLAFNTDAQSLKMSLAPETLQLGEELTQGLGVGGNHELGAQAAEESLDAIQEALEGANMVFITAGMGGGTGTGAAPIIAGVAKNMGALTVAVVTKPFDFEGQRRRDVADEGLAALKDKVDTLIVVPNQRLIEILDEEVSFLDAMKMVDSVLAEGVKSIATLISQTGFINADFNDAKSVMQNAGTALMGIGRAAGENRAEKAAREATSSPLLDLSIEGATGVLYNIIGGPSLTMQEVNKVSELISDAVDPAANIKFGATIDESMNDDIVITIVATGFDTSKQVYTKRLRGDDDKKIDSLIKEEVEEVIHEDVDKLSSKGIVTAEDLLDSVEEEDELHTEKQPDEDITSVNNGAGEDPLDIPAFMRRKKRK